MIRGKRNMRNLVTIWTITVMGLIVVCAGAASADDGFVNTVSGGSVILMEKHPTIRMVGEAVDIKLGANGVKGGWKWPAFVRCQFLLKNNGPATDATIGFPENLTADGDPPLPDKIRGFKSWVDDKVVDVKYTPAGKPDHDDGGRRDYDAWYVKEVHFEAGQTHRIVDVYSSWIGVSGGEGQPSYQNTLTYILCTGSSWRGTIGSAVIRADLSEAGDFYDITASPKGFTRKGNVLTWKMKDLAPKDDVEIKLTPRVPSIIDPRTCLPGDLNPVFIKSGVLMVSSALVTYSGGTERWARGRCTLQKASHVLVLTAGSKSAVLDGKAIQMKTAPVLAERESMAVPFEETVNLLGGIVKYDKNHHPKVVWPHKTH